MRAQPIATSGFRWGERASARLLGVSASSDPRVTAAIITTLLAASWGIARGLGGANAVAPHWFYIPVVLAAVRFGSRGALLAGAAALVLAGPLLPAEMSSMAAQPLRDWLTRGVFFIVIGQVFALASRQPVGARDQTLRVIRADRDLRHAITRGELSVHYQPIFDILARRQRVIGAEALLRWHHPQRGDIPPGTFIPLAEQSALIHDLGEIVLTEVCERITQWRPVVDEHFTIAVNLSARQLDDPDLVARVTGCIEGTGVDPSQLCIEVTETAAMADLDVSRDRLQALRDLGMKIAIDDFGTGQSSLAYIHLLPVDTIKIDQSFIARIAEESEARALVTSAILLAHTLGYDTVAEGVETAEQLALLKSMHCDLAQGFYLGLVTPPDEVTAALEHERQQRERRPRTTGAVRSPS
jgi:EAL domain-containing protein (putative c-di-GMP-specific phosphodiesterase class I)